MARGVNKVILIGNLGNEPEVRYTPSGGAIANINLATSEVWRDKQTGDLQERTEWHRVVFFNRLAEIVGQFLHKGSKCYIEGSLRTRKWQDKNGQERYITEIVATEMYMLDSRSGGVNPSPNSSRPNAGFGNIPEADHMHSDQQAFHPEFDTHPANTTMASVGNDTSSASYTDATVNTATHTDDDIPF